MDGWMDGRTDGQKILGLNNKITRLFGYYFRPIRSDDGLVNGPKLVTQKTCRYIVQNEY